MAARHSDILRRARGCRLPAPYPADMDLTDATAIVTDPEYLTSIDPFRRLDTSARSIQHERVIDALCTQGSLEKPEAAQLAREALAALGGYILNVERPATAGRGYRQSPRTRQVWRIPDGIGQAGGVSK